MPRKTKIKRIKAFLDKETYESNMLTEGQLKALRQHEFYIRDYRDPFFYKKPVKKEKAKSKRDKRNDVIIQNFNYFCLAPHLHLTGSCSSRDFVRRLIKGKEVCCIKHKKRLTILTHFINDENQNKKGE